MEVVHYLEENEMPLLVHYRANAETFEMNLDKWRSTTASSKGIDKKDVAAPTKYKGDASQWRHWYMKFYTFLSRQAAP